MDFPFEKVDAMKFEKSSSGREFVKVQKEFWGNFMKKKKKL